MQDYGFSFFPLIGKNNNASNGKILIKINANFKDLSIKKPINGLTITKNKLLNMLIDDTIVARSDEGMYLFKCASIASRRVNPNPPDNMRKMITVVKLRCTATSINPKLVIMAENFK